MNDSNAIVTMISIKLKARRVEWGEGRVERVEGRVESVDLAGRDDFHVVRFFEWNPIGTTSIGTTWKSSLPVLIRTLSSPTRGFGLWTLDFGLVFTANSLSRRCLVQKTTTAWSNYW